jgi:excisionase family DNA binding protein
MIPKLYTVKEAAEIFGLNRLTIYRWIKDGKITVIWLPGDNIRITQDEIDRLIAPQKEENK